MSNKKNSAGKAKEELISADGPDEQGFKEHYFNPEAGDSKEEPASVLTPPDPAPDIKKPKPLFKRLTLFLLIICLLGVGFLIWQAYSNIISPGNGTSENVILKIEGPKEIISGQATEYKIIFENKSNNIINQAEVSARFPRNFVALSFNPEPINQAGQKTNSIKIAQYFWQFSKLAPGSKKEIIISGQTFGEIGAAQIITASSHYQPENFSSDFKIAKILETEIAGTLISLNITALTEIVDSAEIEYLVKIGPSIKSSAPTSLKDLRVYIEYPVGLDVTNIDTEIKEHSLAQAPPDTNASWLIENLDQEKTIKITGAISGDAGEYKELLVKVGYYSNDEFHLQAGESFITLLIKPELALNLKVNNLDIDSLAVDWTEEVEYSLVAKNQGESELSDIILKLNFSEDDIFNWLSVDCDKGKDCDFLLTTSDEGRVKTLVWTRNQLLGLENLNPGQSLDIKLKLNLNDAPAAESENYHANVTAQADVKIPGLDDSLIVESNQVTLKVVTQAELKTEARYYTDEYLKIGSGPLPPLVGASTNFRIFWEIANTSNSLANVKVQTTLPDNTVFTNKTQVLTGNIKYNAYNRQVTWTIPKISPHPADSIRANFEISITPKISQVGEYLTLTKETTLEAEDDYTGESISAYAGYLTSELENDLAAQGKGRVE